jgi:hypothetical protein
MWLMGFVYLIKYTHHHGVACTSRLQLVFRVAGLCSLEFSDAKSNTTCDGCISQMNMYLHSRDTTSVAGIVEEGIGIIREV